MSARKTYEINGMHCRSCEIVTEKNISNIPGVGRVSVNHKKGTAEVEFTGGRPDDEAVAKAVADSGYSLGKADKLPFLSSNAEDYFDILLGLSALLILWLFAEITGIASSLGGRFSSAPTYPIVFVIGLTAGISTCMAVVGGLVAGFSASYARSHQDATAWERFKPNLWFNAGRVMSYAFFGGVIGAFGSVFRISAGATGLLATAAGFLMLYMGIKLTGISPKISNMSMALPKKLGHSLGLSDTGGDYSHKGAFVGGALTFFLPCGFTQAMQVYAITTGSFASGAVIMSLFALGTVPGLIGIGALTSVLQGSAARMFFRFVGIAVFVLGIINISAGYNLSGIVITLPSFEAAGQNGAEAQLPPVENGEQIVNMDQLTGGYDPNVFTVKKGIPVKWIINSKSSYSCASIIRMPAFQISEFLKEGDNIVRFTPGKAGTFKFTCAMGMYSGIFKVVD